MSPSAYNKTVKPAFQSFQELLDHESYIWFLKCVLAQIKLQMPLLQPSIQPHSCSVLVIPGQTKTSCLQQPVFSEVR